MSRAFVREDGGGAPIIRASRESADSTAEVYRSIEPDYDFEVREARGGFMIARLRKDGSSTPGSRTDQPLRRLCLTISIECARIFLRSVLRLSPSSSEALIWLPPQAFSTMAINGASTLSSTRW